MPHRRMSLQSLLQLLHFKCLHAPCKAMKLKAAVWVALMKQACLRVCMHSNPSRSPISGYTNSRPKHLARAQALQQLRASTQVQDLADVRERMAAGLRALDARGSHAQYGAGAGGDGDAVFMGAAVVKTMEAVGRMQAAGAACARHTPADIMWVKIYGLRPSYTNKNLVVGVFGQLRDSSRSQMLQFECAPEAASDVLLGSTSIDTSSPWGQRDAYALGRLTATLQAALAAMKPLRKTLELLLSQEAAQPAAALPTRSSHVSPGLTLGGALTLESGSQAQYSAMRRAKSSSVLQAFIVAGRPRASEGVEPGLARSIRRAPGETDQLLCRVASSELLRSARTSRDSRVGAPGCCSTLLHDSGCTRENHALAW